MTLKQWVKEYDRVVETVKGAKVIADVMVPNVSRWSLFHLSDYVVSSVTGGSIWLVRRKIPLEERVTI